MTPHEHAIGLCKTHARKTRCFAPLLAYVLAAFGSFSMPAMAGTECAVSEAAFASWLQDRFGVDSDEAQSFPDAPLEAQWGLTVATYIGAALPIRTIVTPESYELGGPFVLRDDLEDGGFDEADLAAMAVVLLLTEDLALCLRPDGGPMMIDGRDMGAQFDATHPAAHRANIRALAESFL